MPSSRFIALPVVEFVSGRSLFEHFSVIPDPRIQRCRKHKLIDILVIAVVAVLCGAESFIEIEEFGKAKLSWFQKRLELPNGIPSHDTFQRVFALLNPRHFQVCFASWVEALQEYLRTQRRAAGCKDADVIAIDGKALRHSFTQAAKNDFIHMVSAWSAVTSLVLGQVKTDAKSNEITAIPALLECLDLQGCIVTIDAMGCQKAIARQIVEQGGDYILALKDNQPTLAQSVKRFFEQEQEAGFRGQPYEYEETLHQDHGRIEKRRFWLVNLNDTTDDDSPLKGGAWLDPKSEWAGLASIGMVERERQVGTGEPSREVHFYLSSLSRDVHAFAHSTRVHWGIENKLHWVLDVAFREDDCRVRTGNAPQNLAILRHITLNLLKQDPSRKMGIKAKRLRAGWDESYLEQLLAGFFY